MKIMPEISFKEMPLKGYKNFSDEDIIMISDIDEIPDPKKLRELISKINLPVS